MKKFTKTTAKILAVVCYIVFGASVMLLLYAELSPGIVVHGTAKVAGCGFAAILLIMASLLHATDYEEKSRKWRIYKTAAWMLFGLYLLYTVNLLFFDSFFRRGLIFALPDYSAEYFQRNLSLVPFRQIRLYGGILSRNGFSRGAAFTNIFGNIAAFMPMGFFLFLLVKWFRKFWRFLLFMLLILASVESLQLFLGTGICDIDDVILNMSGAIAAFGIIKLFTTTRHTSASNS